MDLIAIVEYINKSLCFIIWGVIIAICEIMYVDVNIKVVRVPKNFISKDYKLAKLGRKYKSCMVCWMFSYHLLIK